MIRGIFKEGNEWYYIVVTEGSCYGCPFYEVDESVNYHGCALTSKDVDYKGMECIDDRVIFFEDWLVKELESGKDEEEIDWKKVNWDDPDKEDAVDLLVEYFKERRKKNAK